MVIRLKNSRFTILIFKIVTFFAHYAFRPRHSSHSDEVFGSQATGLSGVSSDIDIMICPNLPCSELKVQPTVVYNILSEGKRRRKGQPDFPINSKSMTCLPFTERFGLIQIRPEDNDRFKKYSAFKNLGIYDILNFHSHS